jgi:hypothetical protein
VRNDQNLPDSIILILMPSVDFLAPVLKKSEEFYFRIPIERQTPKPSRNLNGPDERLKGLAGNHGTILKMGLSFYIYWRSLGAC